MGANTHFPNPYFTKVFPSFAATARTFSSTAKTIATITGTSTASISDKEQRRAGECSALQPHEGMAELGGTKLGHMM